MKISDSRLARMQNPRAIDEDYNDLVEDLVAERKLREDLVGAVIASSAVLSGLTPSKEALAHALYANALALRKLAEIKNAV